MIFKKNRFYGLCIFLVLLTGEGQAQPVHSDTVISIITCGRSSDREVYEAFGHSAIRVYDPVKKTDLVYNYGTFDFDQPHFYLNFTKGLLLYELSVYPYSIFLNYYIRTDRFVHEQVLLLTSDQKKKIVDHLNKNNLPGHRKYRYDYFYNNCSTKIRDIFANVLSQNFRFDTSDNQTHYTIRKLTDGYLKSHPWSHIGIDICLGMPMDKVLSGYEYMFLPDYLEKGFQNAYVRGDSGEWTSAVLNTKIVHDPGSNDEVSFSLFHPLVVFSILLFFTLVITWWNWKRNTKFVRVVDIILFGATGIFGLFLILLWTMTDHQAATNNANLLWVLPTHIIAAFMIFFRLDSLLTYYYRGCAILYILILITWPIFPQQFNMSLYPLVAVLMVRCVGWSVPIKRRLHM